MERRVEGAGPSATDRHWPDSSTVDDESIFTWVVLPDEMSRRVSSVVRYKHGRFVIHFRDPVSDEVSDETVGGYMDGDHLPLYGWGETEAQAIEKAYETLMLLEFAP